MCFFFQMNEQIEKHEQAKKSALKEKRLNQDARIEAEKSYAAEQEMAKHRRVREQKAYRDFLFGQMNERKARETHKQFQDRKFLENKMMTTNQKDMALNKQVSKIDVDDLQRQSKGEQNALTKNAHLT